MLVLDSEALSVLAHGPMRSRQLLRSLILEAARDGHEIATVAAVLAEVIRGRRADAAVFASLRREGIAVRTVDARVGVRAGELLGAAGAGSELAVDAFVVALADLAGDSVVATADVRDLERLAEHAANVVVADIRAH